MRLVEEGAGAIHTRVQSGGATVGESDHTVQATSPRSVLHTALAWSCRAEPTAWLRSRPLWGCLRLLFVLILHSWANYGAERS